MTANNPSLLINRPEDLVRLGVRWIGAEASATADGDVVLDAGAGAIVTITFPPQSIAELPLDGNGIADGRLSDVSQLAFQLKSGARVPLTAEGILTALTGAELVAAGSDSDPNGSILDLPLGLLSTLGSGTTRAVCSTSSEPAASGGVGLWQVELRSSEEVSTIMPLAWPDAPSLPAPFAVAKEIRDAIVASGAPLPASVVLGALGATFDMEFVGEDLRWSHRSAVGREQKAVTVTKGVLYPLGHRATCVTVTERRIDADGLPAALHTKTQIIVTEPVRQVPRADFRFGAVELLSRTMKVDQALNPVARPIGDPDIPEVGELNDSVAKIDALSIDIAQLVDWSRDGLNGLGAAGYSEAIDYQVLIARRDELQADLDSDPEGQDPTGVAAVRKELKEVTAQAKALWPAVLEDINNLKQRIAETQSEINALRAVIIGLQAEIAEIKQVRSNPRNVSFWPADERGQFRKFDVRMATPRGDLHVQMPLIFVNDFVDVDVTHLPDFASLTDFQTVSKLRQQWTSLGGSEVKVPGVNFDVVQAAIAEAGDVHEIHALVIEAAEVVETYAPRIARIDAKIASLRALLPDQDKITSLVYNFGENALASPLKPLLPIAIDFIANADRSGGLVAPKFQADAISRTLGPAAAAVLDEAHLPNFASLYADTRMLGLSLGEIIDEAAQGITIPRGPTIVPLLEGVRPVGVKMTWSNLPLKAAGIFRPLDRNQPCRMDLQAVISGKDTTTTATITNFALALPAGTPVATIGFTSLTMEQATGKPPAVHVGTFSFELGEELKLLEDLQSKVLSFFHDNDPGIVVRRTPTGVSAGYAFSLPEVSSGVFLMRNLGASVDLDVPFNGDDVTVKIGFARPDNQFTLAVTIFGGGGYFQITMARSGVAGVDLSLQFGAYISVSFLVAKGEVHAYGLVRLKIDKDAPSNELDASLRLGGSLDVLGIVSVSIELVLLLEYEIDRNLLKGRATLVIEVHILFFSRSVQIDSGEWIIAGSDSTANRRLAGTPGLTPLDPAAAKADWLNYWQAFS